MNYQMFDAQWFKSSHSGGDGECVEVAWLEGGLIGVRDSKNPAAPALVFHSEAWEVFVSGVRGCVPVTYP